MKSVHTSLVSNAHAYTRSSAPWRLDDETEGGEADGKGKKPRRRIFHYLTGGGIGAFGRTAEEDEAEYRRTRFLVVAGFFALVYLALMIF